jgi:porin
MRLNVCGAVGLAALCGASLGMASSRALAQAEDTSGLPASSIARSFPGNGDPGGGRAALAARGITYGLNYTGEVFGVASGGIRRGSTYSGLLEGIVDVDLEKLAGWRGLTFHTSAFQIHGRGITASHVGSLNAISNIEATAATRLFELWLEQELVKDTVSVRLGQMRVDYDGEFLNSQTAGLFLNANFGWPPLTAVNLPSGGVSYPLAGMGVRVKYKPSESLTLLGAVFNDDPAGVCASEDPQVCNDNGLKFRMKDDPFVIAEAQYRYSGGNAPTGQIKVGGFVDFARFDHQRRDADGLSLADPMSSGIARRLRGDHGLYAVIDQQLYRPASNAGESGGIFAFGRIAGMPSDRNEVDFTVDGGLLFRGMVPRRPGDELGLGFAFNRISRGAVGLDRDTLALTDEPTPVRSNELLFELTYKAKIVEGLYLQPDLQYIWRPGGGAADPNRPDRRIDDALVLGLRGGISY